LQWIEGGPPSRGSPEDPEAAAAMAAAAGRVELLTGSRPVQKLSAGAMRFLGVARTSQRERWVMLKSVIIGRRCDVHRH
jgi:hypothetical protein